MSSPIRPARQLTPAQYQRLKDHGWSDEEIQADHLALPRSMHPQWVQEDEAGKVTQLPAGAPQPLRQESGTEHALGAARALSQGITLGWGEEIAGGAAALQRINDALLHGQLPKSDDLKAAYEHTRDTERANDAAYQAAHPKEGTALRVAGAAVPTTLAALIAPQAAAGSALQTIARGAGTLGGVGLVGGLGTGQGTLAEQGRQALPSTLTGLVSGAALPATLLAARAAAPYAGAIGRGLVPRRMARLLAEVAKQRAGGKASVPEPPPETPPEAPPNTSASPPSDPRITIAAEALRKAGVPEADIPNALRAAGIVPGPPPPSGLQPVASAAPTGRGVWPRPAAARPSGPPIPIGNPAVTALRQAGFEEADIPHLLQTAKELGIGEADLPGELAKAQSKVGQMLPETAARVQPGATRGQINYRAQRLGLPEGPEPPQGVPSELNPNDPANLEFLLRGTIEKLQRGETSGSLKPGAVPSSASEPPEPSSLEEAFKSGHFDTEAARRDQLMRSLGPLATAYAARRAQQAQHPQSLQDYLRMLQTMPDQP